MHTRPSSSKALLVAVIAVPLGLILPGLAAGPVFWTVATSTEFVQGRSEGVFVSLDGAVLAGPDLTSRLTSSPPQVWSLVAAANATLWAGTGGDGRLLRLRAGQPEEVVFDADEHSIFAVAVSGDSVYAATSPDGQIYRVGPDGRAQPFFNPSEKYIWALAVDPTGRLWVGAGNPAVIYRLDAAGQSQFSYKPAADHVVALAVDNAGRMLAGTESPGRLYRFDTADRPFVLLESGLTELRAIAPGADGVLFAAGVDRRDASASDDQSTSVSITVAESAAPAAAPATPPARRSVLYRIATTGMWEAIWETPDLIYDVAPQADGGVLAATGPAGRLYRISATREVLLHSGVDARQITRFATGPSGTPVAIATANPGRVIAIGAGVQSPASYLSPVRDTNSVATWGLLRWQALGAVRLFTRSGNTAEPDDSWSAWSAPLTRPAGESITSPAARYLQWKAELTTSATSPARLEAVTAAYLPRNSRPVVSAITTHPPGVVFQRSFGGEEGSVAGLDDAVAAARRPPGDSPSPPAPGRKMFQKGLQTLTWKAEDADGDLLSYAIDYRLEGEAWRPLRRDLGDQIYVWDTTSTPDGRYEVRLRASDAPANTADRALEGDRIAETVQVDNTPPVVTTSVHRDAAGVRLVVLVVDASSPVQKLEYSIAGGNWQIVNPVDGLADSLEEGFEIPLASDADAARVVVRAIDLLQNVATRSGAGR